MHADDLEYAREFDLRLKLLGVAERVEDGISLSVKPTFVPLSHPLASISGSMNAITIEGEAFRMLTFSGPGAGGLETASAILADIVSVMRSEHQSIPVVSTLPIKDVNHAFYLHLEISDHSGVLAAVSTALATEGISIRSVLQRGLGETARLIIILHPVSRQRLVSALEALQDFKNLHGAVRTIRVLQD